MLVVHANWSEAALHLWAESLDGYVAMLETRAAGAGPERLDERGPDAAAAESAAAHPFALTGEELAACFAARPDCDLVNGHRAAADGGVHLRLPTARARPLASDRLAGVIAAEEESPDAHLGVFRVPSLAIAGGDAIGVLLALEDAGPTSDIEFSHGLRYWMAVARFVLELLLDQRFVPTLFQTRHAELRAAWQPWLHDESARARVGALLAAMPPVVRAVVDDHQGRPWAILDDALCTLTDATVRRALIDDDFGAAIDGRDGATDPHVAWLAGLLAGDDRVDAGGDGASEMLRDVGCWIASLDERSEDRPLRLCFRLGEPDAADLPDAHTAAEEDVRWRLGLRLLGLGDDPPIIDAEQVWRDPVSVQVAAGGGVRNPEEILLSDLGRAARLYPRLETALTEAAPTGVDLTTAEASEFLTEFRDLLEESGFAVEVPPWWGKPWARLGVRLELQSPDLPATRTERASSSAGASVLGLDSIVAYRWQIAVGDRPLTGEELEALRSAAAGGSLFRLHGRWVQLAPGQLETAARFLDEVPEGEITVHEAIRLMHGAGDGRPPLPILGMDATGWVADLLGASSGEGRMPRLDQPAGFRGTLRPYQKIGLSWLSFLDRFGLGTCLADDMGLGKTIQLIALLLAERENGDQAGGIGATLLIVPTSVVSNWEREIARFAPTLRVHVQHGPDRPVGDRLIEIAETCDVVITTYTLVTRDRETLIRRFWHRVVLDEAQYIKNPPTKQTATIKALKTVRRVALTGTPVENRLSELWSIMEFCNAGYLGPPGDFRRRFAVPIERHRDQERAEQLRNLVRPFVLRRLKTDPTVIDDLPPCVTTREYATLTAEQAALYEKTVSDMLGQVGESEGIRRRGLVLATLVRLKQICDHPALLSTGPRSARKSKAAVPPGRAGAAQLSGRSGKSARLIEMLEEVLATGDKALIFTQFRQMGHLLTAMLTHDLDCEVMFLHGGTPRGQRQKMIDRFQDPNGGVPLFVLSLKAGGIGVNLTAANHVFHFDRWWNPAVENQATDRAFRIGQTRTVHVHKFVCMGTLEERIDQMIERKSELAQNIIGAGEQWLTELSTGQLQDLLALRDSAMESEA